MLACELLRSSSFDYQTFDRLFRSNSMKKNIISLAVAATVLGGAAAQAGQYVSPDKMGQFYRASI